MKKLIILFLICVGAILGSKKGLALSYQGFEDITLNDGKLLGNFTNGDYDYYYKQIKRRKFMGWKIYYAHENLKVKYVSETVFSYYNDGSAPLTYTYSLETSKTEKFGISGTGSIGYNSNKSEKSFKNGLQAALKLDASYQQSSNIKEETDLKVTVNPHSVATLRIVGEGLLTNGVAARYFFFIRLNRGGFEYFIVTTEYPRLEILTL